MPDNSRLSTFVGAETGTWSIVSIAAIVGETLPHADKLNILNGPIADPPQGAKWALRGVTSNSRYTTSADKDTLSARQENIGRPTATRAALIPIRKRDAWWNLSQDERRAVFEETSNHIGIGLKYLPQIARRLHHCRDLGSPERFDFLTFFDYEPQYEQAFDDLLAELRATEEWKYIEHEVDIRLAR